ncbi:ATP-grasp domain-containing protein [Woeseia oceani]|uniref:Prokaryotic glutathione synthetase ATP-binding domain-containing protein n=1 Tax=Woeseia oceani TaxID=1548547 RepID=A0A193LHL9_9GAMM|nr:hypothetical protein [Woeseia oceani]ANO52007.1 hypothetical protein BA177_13085 [Woeseia oceani]
MSTDGSRRCAFLTMDNTEGWSIDADLAIAPLQAKGWRVEVLPWRSERDDWASFDGVYVGTPWDYPDDPQTFLQALQRIEASGTVLANPLSLLRWNLAKTYLRDLESRGVAIVPTEWLDTLTEPLLNGLHDKLDSERIVIKPVISTNASNTFLLEREISPEIRAILLDTFAARPCMAQPFVAAIQSEGEYSLFYIGGEMSHAIRKVPKPADFRVQEEHGARILAVDVEPALQQTADQLMQLIKPMPLYARADFVRAADGRFLLMELELIEPSLYLRMVDAAPERFAVAFDHYVQSRSEK